MGAIFGSSMTSFSMKIVTLLQLLLVTNHVLVQATLPATSAADVAESHQINQAQPSTTTTDSAGVIHLRFERRGPWGGEGGSEFDDITFLRSKGVIDVLGIQNITLWHAENYIRGIRVQYLVTNGVRVYPEWGEFHGRRDGKFADVDLHSLNDQLHEVRGFYGRPGPYNALTSIKLETNDGTYGPFGNQDGQSFESGKSKNTIIVGIFGRSEEVLDSLGVYIKDLLLDHGGD